MAAKKAADSVKKTSGPSHIAKEDGRPAVEACIRSNEGCGVDNQSFHRWAIGLTEG